jgi:transcription elongation factor Elf1
MATSKTFQCPSCDTEGKIVIRSDDIGLEEIVYCPVCGADILDEDSDEYY